jgi:histidinol-phosphate aminotransferase
MRKFDSSLIFRPELAELKAYSPVHGNFEVRLDANEAPSILSPAARKRLGEVGASIDYSLYPDAGQKDLRKAIADHEGVSPAEVTVGVGSDELISILLTIASRPRSRAAIPTVLTTTPTFVMYRLSARIRGQRVMEVPLDENWDIDTDGLTRAIQFAEPNLIFVATPNNPTGTMASEDRLIQVIEAAKEALVVVDEAYINYADRNHLELLKRYSNVVILRTLSKIGFAGLRLGWLIGPKAIVSELDKARLPYNITTHSQKLATTVFTELLPEVDRITRYVKTERSKLSDELSKMKGIRVVPSQANFLWLELDRPSEEVFLALGKEGVLVRSFHGRGGRLDRCLRVTVGTEAQNARFLESLHRVL